MIRLPLKKSVRIYRNENTEIRSMHILGLTLLAQPFNEKYTIYPLNLLPLSHLFKYYNVFTYLFHCDLNKWFTQICKCYFFLGNDVVCCWFGCYEFVCIIGFEQLWICVIRCTIYKFEWIYFIFCQFFSSEKH